MGDFVAADPEGSVRARARGDKSFKMQGRFSSLEGRSRPLLTLARSITPGYDVPCVRCFSFLSSCSVPRSRCTHLPARVISDRSEMTMRAHFRSADFLRDR